MHELLTLEEFIKKEFKTKADFARSVGIFPQQVSTWIRKGYMVHNGLMLRPMRNLIEAK